MGPHHRHTDLQDEFRARIADNTGNQPPALRKLHEANAEATEKIQELRAELAGLKAILRQYERVVQVLALENHQLKTRKCVDDQPPCLRYRPPQPRPAVPLRDVGR